MQSEGEVQAVNPLEEAIKADPNWFMPRIKLAEVFLSLKRYGDASKQLDVVLTRPLRFPANQTANFWTMLGKCRYEDEMSKPEGSRKFDSASAAFEKALAADKKCHEASYYLARIALSKGDVAKASDYIKTSLEAQPASPQYHTLNADIRYRQGKPEEAAAELQDVLEKLKGVKDVENSRDFHDAKGLLGRIQSELNSKKYKQYGLVGGGIAVVVIGLALFMATRRGGQGGGAVFDGADMGTEASTYEEICKSALIRLSALTQMSHGVVYVTTVDGDEMQPKTTLVLETEDVKTTPVDATELPRWIERNDGKPFLFKAEKKEGTFIKAFPDLRDALEPLQIRIGVPFLFQDRMLGMAFLGVEESKDIHKLKKLYDRSQGDLYRLAVEYAAALYRLYEDNLATIDVVTKFKSKRYVEENLPRALVDAEDSGRKGAVLMFEFDQFRGLQEQYGDGQAESVLKSVAAEVKAAIPPDDSILARFEGGRFLAFAPVADQAEAMKIAERIKQRVSDTRISQNFPRPTASVAVAIFPDNAKKADDLIWSAERVVMGLSAGGGNAIATVDGGAAAPGGASASPAGQGAGPGAPRPPAAPPSAFSGGPPPSAPSAPAPPKGGFVPGFSGGTLRPSPVESEGVSAASLKAEGRPTGAPG
ncbi:MAG: GGDEF domain-containing protein, partial [Proteobacteria bacterium]|nr:GGDEF domain-containing protein [Pseudomonadota bacterium]